MIRKTIYILLSAFVCLGAFAQRLTDEQIRASLETKATTYPTDPAAGSIHIDRATEIIDGINKSYKDMSPAELIQYVFAKAGSAVTIENVEAKIYNWNESTGWGVSGAKGLAYFNKANSNFLMEEGLVLMPGDARLVEGPDEGDGKLPGAGVEGDDDLQNLLLAAGLVADVKTVAILEFDFIPTGSIVEFKYIFGSEEYPNYIGDQYTYNDVFGFFVNKGRKGENPATKENIARLPSTTTGTDIVTIKNVNHLKNSEYYIDNTSGASNEMDGHTVVLTATHKNMTPCTPYHLKLAICNAGDNSHGSAVLLQANSLVMGTEMEVYGNFIAGARNIFKDCNNNFIRLRNRDITAKTVTLSYGGELTNGTHYTQTNGTALPTSVTIPANDSIDVPVIVTAAATSGKYFDVTLKSDCPSGTDGVSRIYVYNSTAPSFTTTLSKPCSGMSNGKVTVNVTSGLSGMYEYSIGGSVWQDSNVFDNLSSGSRYVYVREKWSCKNSSSYITLSAFSANAGADIMGGTLNADGTITFTMAATGPATGETGLWSVVNSTPGVTITSTSAYNTKVTLDPKQTRTATLRWTLSNGSCSAYDDVVITYRSAQVNPHLRSGYK